MNLNTIKKHDLLRNVDVHCKKCFLIFYLCNMFSVFLFITTRKIISDSIQNFSQAHQERGGLPPSPLPHIESPACNIISPMVYCLFSMSLFLSQLFFLMIDYFIFMFFFWRDHKISWSLYIHSISLGSTFILHLFSRNHHEESYFLRILLSMILILFIRIGLSTTCSFSIHFC